MKFWGNTRREWMLIGVLVGVVLAVAAYTVAGMLA